MNDQLLRLCKRLNKFTLEEMKTIADDVDEAVLKLLLFKLVQEKKLIRQNSIYFYDKKISTNKNITKLPFFFQFHSKDVIELILKGFCTDIEVAKMTNLLDLSTQVTTKFYNYFRELIYLKQQNKLMQYFEETPKIGQERSYLNTKVYLYLYQGNLYVSEKFLKSPNLQKHTESERLEIKNIYLRSYRKVLSRSFAHKFHLHLCEEIWKCGKAFKQRCFELKGMIFL